MVLLLDAFSRCARLTIRIHGVRNERSLLCFFDLDESRFVLALCQPLTRTKCADCKCRGVARGTCSVLLRTSLKDPKSVSAARFQALNMT